MEHQFCSISGFKIHPGRGQQAVLSTTPSGSGNPGRFQSHSVSLTLQKMMGIPDKVFKMSDFSTKSVNRFKVKIYAQRKSNGVYIIRNEAKISTKNFSPVQNSKVKMLKYEKVFSSTVSTIRLKRPKRYMQMEIVLRANLSTVCGMEKGSTDSK